MQLLENLSRIYTHLKFVSNEWEGDIVATCMADGSDAPEDILLSYKMICEDGYDCVFCSRFIKGGQVENYPFV